MRHGIEIEIAGALFVQSETFHADVHVYGGFLRSAGELRREIGSAVQGKAARLQPRETSQFNVSSVQA